MEILAAVGMLTNLVSVGSNLFNQVSQISTTIAKAQAEGRTHLTTDEWTAIIAADDAARKALEEAIKAAS